MTFTMWSFGHFIFILSPLVFAFILIYLTKNKTQEEKRKIGLWLSWLAILILVMRNIEIFYKDDFQFDYEIVPLQICHFANFVLLLAFWKNSKPLFAFALLLNLPAAMMSILFANSLENYATILTFRGMAYIFGHLLIVSLAVYAYVTGFVVLNRSIFQKTLKIVAVLYVSSVFINNLFRLVFLQESNFFYTFKPESGTPLEIFFDWGSNLNWGGFMINPIYLVMTAALGFVVMGLVYLLAKYLQDRRALSYKQELVTE
ncbi:MAG: YwaF family protein [Candidatus Izemoplasmatales bacterium]|nr:YwaF family protein [Candidatus Izemoplasmatales bacterium]